jgi:hypothetical protein
MTHLHRSIPKVFSKIITRFIMVQNKAAWLDGARKPLEVRDGPEQKVGENDVLIENKAVAINPG